jgi:cytochrome c oxidase subunit 3
MEIGLIVLAIMLASLLGWLLKQSFNTQPWIAEAVEESSYQAPFNARPKLVALTTFLAVATSFFALILSAYALRMEYGDWVPMTEPQLLWVNTVMLVLASVAFQWTRNHATSGRNILGGMYVWARATARAFGDRDADAVKHSVELCTIYWHFLLLVWLVLFGLMLST